MKIRGTRDDDTLTGGNDPDVIRGLLGDDSLTGGGGGDKLYGGDGDDQLDGGLGSDRLFGDAGEDHLVDTSNGSDTLSGGADNDLLELTRQSSTSTDVVVLRGDDGDDHLVYSGAAAAKVSATLFGDDGDDTIETSGSATIHGGAGHDTIRLQYHADVMVVDAGDGDDIVFLGNNSATSNAISLGAGNDTFDENGCTFRVLGGDGDDTFSTLNARKGVILAGSGDDIVRANNTEQDGLRIDAGDGADLVSINTSSSGTHHTVTLGEGLDTLELRADNFLFDANVTVTDFDTGRGGDKIRLSDYLAVMADGFDGTDPFASGYLRLEQSETSTLLQFDHNGGGDEWRTLVVFENARAAAFRAANFDDGYDPTYGSPMIPSHELLPLIADAVAP